MAVGAIVVVEADGVVVEVRVLVEFIFGLDLGQELDQGHRAGEWPGLGKVAWGFFSSL